MFHFLHIIVSLFVKIVDIKELHILVEKNLRNETLNFGPKIKAIRKEKNFTVRQAALQAGISNSFWSQVENKHREIPKPNTLEKMAKGLRISKEEIYELAGISAPENKKTSENIADEELSDNQILIAHSIDPDVSDEEREAIINMVKEAMKFRKRL